MKNNRPMIALLKKDWGLNRVPIFGGLVLISLPYLLVLLLAITARGSVSPRQISEPFMFAAAMADVLTVLLAAVFGGAALAQERRERSADFLAMMPVSRTQIVASKLILAALVLSALGGINFAAYDLAWHYGYSAPERVNTNIVAATLFSSVGLLMLFGLAWLFSSFLSSPAVAACIAIGIGCAALFWPELIPPTIRDRMNVPAVTMFVVFVSLGSLGLVIGTANYLRRVEP